MRVFKEFLIDFGKANSNIGIFGWYHCFLLYHDKLWIGFCHL